VDPIPSQSASAITPTVTGPKPKRVPSAATPTRRPPGDQNIARDPGF